MAARIVSKTDLAGQGPSVSLVVSSVLLCNEIFVADIHQNDYSAHTEKNMVGALENSSIAELSIARKTCSASRCLFMMVD